MIEKLVLGGTGTGDLPIFSPMHWPLRHQDTLVLRCIQISFKLSHKFQFFSMWNKNDHVIEMFSLVDIVQHDMNNLFSSLI